MVIVHHAFRKETFGIIHLFDLWFSVSRAWITGGVGSGACPERGGYGLDAGIHRPGSFLTLPIFGGLGLAEGMDVMRQLGVQLTALFVVGLWSIVMSTIILKIIGLYCDLRVSSEEETEGLDLVTHGEKGCDL